MQSSDRSILRTWWARRGAGLSGLAPRLASARGCRGWRGGRARPGSGGFTLPELLTVVAILGVVGVLAMAKITRRSRADSAAGLGRELHTRLVQARFAAITSGARVLVRLQPGTSVAAAQLMSALQPGQSPPPPGDGFGSVTDEVRSRPSSAIVAVAPVVDGAGPMPAPGAAADLIFYPDGRAQLSGVPGHPGVTIYIADDLGEHQRRITVLGRTGFARLVER